MGWEVTWIYDAKKILEDTLSRSIGDALSIPTRKENNMVPHTTGDILDLLGGLMADMDTPETRRMHDYIRGKLCSALSRDGLELVWDQEKLKYIVTSNPDRELG